MIGLSSQLLAGCANRRSSSNNILSALDHISGMDETSEALGCFAAGSDNDKVPVSLDARLKALDALGGPVLAACFDVSGALACNFLDVLVKPAR